MRPRHAWDPPAPRPQRRRRPGDIPPFPWALTAILILFAFAIGIIMLAEGR